MHLPMIHMCFSICFRIVDHSPAVKSHTLLTGMAIKVQTGIASAQMVTADSLIGLIPLRARVYGSPLYMEMREC